MTDAKTKMGGAPQGALPLAPKTVELPAQDDCIWVWRWPDGWDREIRLEAYAPDDPERLARVFIRDNEGRAVEIDRNVVWDIRNTCGDDLISAIHDDHDARRRAHAKKVGDNG